MQVSRRAGTGLRDQGRGHYRGKIPFHPTERWSAFLRRGYRYLQGSAGDVPARLPEVAGGRAARVFAESRCSERSPPVEARKGPCLGPWLLPPPLRFCPPGSDSLPGKLSPLVRRQSREAGLAPLKPTQTSQGNGVRILLLSCHLFIEAYAKFQTKTQAWVVAGYLSWRFNFPLDTYHSAIV